MLPCGMIHGILLRRSEIRSGVGSGGLPGNGRDGLGRRRRSGRFHGYGGRFLLRSRCWIFLRREHGSQESGGKERGKSLSWAKERTTVLQRFDLKRTRFSATGPANVRSRCRSVVPSSALGELSPVEVAARLRPLGGVVFFDSALERPDRTELSLLAAAPWQILRGTWSATPMLYGRCWPAGTGPVDR